MTRHAEFRRIDTGSVALHVALRGSGPPLLLLHGFTGGGDSLGPVVDHFARSHRTIAPDLVGHGRSDVPDTIDAYSMAACIAQLVAVLDALAIERADVFGYSMGGRAALALCARHPERVRRAVLLGASAGLTTAEERATRIASDTALAQRIEREGVPAFVKVWAEIPLFASQRRRLTPAQRADAQRRREANTATGLAHSLRGMGTGAQPPLHGALSQIRNPVLCLAGTEDVKFREIARELSHALPNGRAAEIPEAGHAAHLENPQATAELTLRFLAAPFAYASAQATGAHAS
jgi:2-succinyl-6-hydroxy-2,4-cyclohexadiene-1-carboxylate synthase